MSASADVRPETSVPPCGCLRCLSAKGEFIEFGGVRLNVASTRMVVCVTCGNKRCPHSDDHDNPCTGSNEPGQPGSRYA